MTKRKKKGKIAKIDGEIGAEETKRIRAAIRQVWQWTSIARRNCIKRVTDKKGFAHCELCSTKVPKVYVDHIEVMGDIFKPNYLKRMWCHSSHLQALCSKCHNKKTYQERKEAERIKRKSFLEGFNA